MERKTIKTKSHAVPGPMESCTGVRMEGKKKKSFVSMLHKNFTKKYPKRSVDDDQKIERNWKFFHFFLCAFEVIIIKSRFSTRRKFHLISFQSSREISNINLARSSLLLLFNARYNG